MPNIALQDIYAFLSKEVQEPTAKIVRQALERLLAPLAAADGRFAPAMRETDLDTDRRKTLKDALYLATGRDQTWKLSFVSLASDGKPYHVSDRAWGDFVWNSLGGPISDEIASFCDEESCYFDVENREEVFDQLQTDLESLCFSLVDKMLMKRMKHSFLDIDSANVQYFVRDALGSIIMEYLQAAAILDRPGATGDRFEHMSRLMTMLPDVWPIATEKTNSRCWFIVCLTAYLGASRQIFLIRRLHGLIRALANVRPLKQPSLQSSCQCIKLLALP